MCSNSKGSHTTTNYDEKATEKKTKRNKQMRKKRMVCCCEQQENELLSGACQTSIVIRLIDVRWEKSPSVQDRNGLCSSSRCMHFFYIQTAKIVTMRNVRSSFDIFITCSFFKHLHNCNAICTYPTNGDKSTLFSSLKVI